MVHSYIPLLFVLVIGLAGFPVACVAPSSVQLDDSTHGTIARPILQNLNTSMIGVAGATIPELSWTEGQPFPTVEGSIIFPSLAPRLPGALAAQSYATHWYAGSVYPSWLPTQNAVTIYTTINVPSSGPSSDEFYYVLLSAWDSAGSYDQIGFSDTWGTWGLTYSWTSGPPSNPTYHYSSNAMPLSLGVAYTFYITTQSGVTHFAAYQSLSQVWSLDAPTGGNYLVLSYSYSGYYDYTDYEEVWYTSTPGGAPAFSFYFYNNYWIPTSGGSNAATWSSWTSSGTPSNVVVVISGDSVLVTNPTTVISTQTVTSTQSSTIYSYGTTTTTTTSYTSTSTLTSTIPTVTTVVLVPLTITSTDQSTQFLTSVLTTTVTNYTSTTTSTSTIPTTVALVPLTMTSTAQSTQYLTSILTTTVTSYTGTETSTSTIPTLTTVILVPSSVTSTVQSTQLLTSILTTTITNYTSTWTSTSTIPTVTTVVLLPSTVTSTTQGTQYLTSILTTTVTNYTSTTTSTSTSVVYTTVTASPGGAEADASSPLAYLGFISLLAITAGHRVTAGRSWRTPRSSSAESHRKGV